MPIETKKEFYDWIKAQPQETCVFIAARAALRVFPILTHGDVAKLHQSLALLAGRAILTTGVAATLPSLEIRLAADAVARATDAADAPYPAPYAAARQAVLAGADPADAADAAAFPATYAAARAAGVRSEPTFAETNDVLFNAAAAAQAAADAEASASTDAAAYADAETVTKADADVKFGAIFSNPIWHSPGEPDWLVSFVSSRDNLLETGPEWAFWREWYQGFLEGNPMDWELQRRVALIPDLIWEAGPEAVAEEIARIRLEYETEGDGEEPRRPEYEPQSVEKLFDNKAVITASISQMSSDVAGAVERFHSETGINQLPDSFLPLQAIPNSLSRINAVLKHEQPSTETEQKLREEIGRLNAKIAQLEKELKTASKSAEPIIAPAYKKQLATSLGDWKLYAALCAGLWVISGDQLGIQKRLENILSLRETLFGADCPSPTKHSKSDPTIET